MSDATKLTKFHRTAGHWVPQSLDNITPLLITTYSWGAFPQAESAEYYPNEQCDYIDSDADEFISQGIRLKAVSARGCKYLEHPNIGDCMVVDVEVSGIDKVDAPDYADAYYSRAVWAHSGVELTSEELDRLAEKYPTELRDQTSMVV